MPNLTPVFKLPYPSGSDAPCDFDEQWCAFTAAMDAVFATWQSGVDRTVPVVPAAKLLLATTTTVPAGNPVPFDTVVADTAAMTDLDADPYRITIPQTGRYTITSMLRKPTSGVLNSEITTSVVTSLGGVLASTNTRGEALDRGAGATYFVPAYTAVVSLAAGTKLTLTFSIGSLVNVTIEGASLSAVWHSDTEVP